MNSYLNLMAGQMGISTFFLVALVIWSAFWKLVALWKAGRNNSPVWFIVLALVNTLGILEILYIFVFSDCCKKKTTPKPRKSRRKRK